MAEVGATFVTVAPSARGFGGKLDQQIGGEVKSSGGRAGKVFGTSMKLAAGAVIGAGLIGAKILKDSFGEAREAQKVGAQTNAVIKSTGGIAKVTAKSVGNLSTAISLKSGIDDEAIQSGANMLLTFTGIRNEAGKGNKVFNQTVQAATDMSVAMGTDAKSAALTLGKALNDPAKGLTKLQKQGVTFTDQQKKQVAAMVKSGNTLGAQKLILGEVNKEFGGSAAAQATAGDKFKVAFGNLEESIGTALLPVLDKVLNAGTKFATFLTNDISPNIAALNGYLAPAIASIGSFFRSLSGGGSGSGVLTTFKTIGASIAKNFLPVLQTMSTTFQTIVLPALLRLGAYLSANLVPIFSRVGTIIATQVVPIVASLARFLYGTLYPAIAKIVTQIAGSLKPVFDQLFATIQTSVLPSINQLLVKFRQWQPTIQRVIVVLVQVIGFILRLAAVILGRVLPVLIRFAGFLIRLVVGAIIRTISAIVKIIGFFFRVGSAVASAAKAFARFSNAVDSHIRSALHTVASLPGKAKSALGSAGSALVDAGRRLIDGLIRGIGDRIGAAVQKVRDGLNKIKHMLPGSPIKEGPLVGWNNTGPNGPGGRLVGLLADGMANTRAIDSTMDGLTRRIAIKAPRVDSSFSTSGSVSGSSASAKAGDRWHMVLDDGTQIGGYMQRVADRSVSSAASLYDETQRAI